MLWGYNMSKYDYEVDINSELVRGGREGGIKGKMLVGAGLVGAASSAINSGVKAIDKGIDSQFHNKDERKGGFGTFFGNLSGVDPTAGFKGDYQAAKRNQQSKNYKKANSGLANDLNVNLDQGTFHTQGQWDQKDQLTNLAQTSNRRKLGVDAVRTATQGQAGVDIANIHSQVGAQNALNDYNSTSTMNDAKSQNAQLGFDSTNYRNTANSNIASNNYDSTTAQNSAKAAGAMNSAGVDMFKQVASAYDPNAVGTDGVAGGALPDITSALDKGANAQTQLAQSNANALGTRNSAYNLAESSNAAAYGGMNSAIQNANTGTAKAYGTMNSTNSAHNTNLANAQTKAISGNLDIANRQFGLDDQYAN